MTRIQIAHRSIGSGLPAFIIAEMSANHRHDFSHAEELVRAAKACGADAIKLQTYTPDTMTIDCDAPCFKVGKGTIWEGKKLYDLYGEAYTPWEWQPRLKAIAEDIGLVFFSTPFDASAVDFLEEMHVPAFKVASFENNDIPLLKKIGSTGKPVIMSTGMAALDEIEEAVGTLRSAGCREIALLKCTSAYPSPVSDMNLATIPHLAEALDLPVGLSDHTLGTTSSIAAVALGACIIEKHFTMSRDVPGPDSAFSLEPAELKTLVESVRDVEVALGQVTYDPTEKEKASMVFRRSLFVVEDIAVGEPFTETNVRCIRPGDGLHPRCLDAVLRQRASRDIERGTPLSRELVDGKLGS